MSTVSPYPFSSTAPGGTAPIPPPLFPGLGVVSVLKNPANSATTTAAANDTPTSMWSGRREVSRKCAFRAKLTATVALLLCTASVVLVILTMFGEMLYGEEFVPVKVQVPIIEGSTHTPVPRMHIKSTYHQWEICTLVVIDELQHTYFQCRAPTEEAFVQECMGLNQHVRGVQALGILTVAFGGLTWIALSVVRHRLANGPSVDQRLTIVTVATSALATGCIATLAILVSNMANRTSAATCANDAAAADAHHDHRMQIIHADTIHFGYAFYVVIGATICLSVQTMLLALACWLLVPRPVELQVTEIQVTSGDQGTTKRPAGSASSKQSAKTKSPTLDLNSAVRI